jgi:hypothetical protein
MIVCLYLLFVAVSLGALAVLLRRRPAPPVPPTPKAPAPAPAAALRTGADEIRTILAAAAQLAARLDTAA